MRRLGLVWVALAAAGCSCGERAPAPPDAAVVAAAVSPDAAGPSDVSGLDEAGRTLCARLCAVLAPVGCASSPTCVADCELGVGSRCADAWRSYYGCVAGLPAAELYCNAVNRPDVRAGNCTGEHDEVARCLTARR